MKKTEGGMVLVRKKRYPATWIDPGLCQSFGITTNQQAKDLRISAGLGGLDLAPGAEMDILLKGGSFQGKTIIVQRDSQDPTSLNFFPKLG